MTIPGGFFGWAGTGGGREAEQHAGGEFLSGFYYGGFSAETKSNFKFEIFRFQRGGIGGSVARLMRLLQGAVRGNYFQNVTRHSAARKANTRRSMPPPRHTQNRRASGTPVPGYCQSSPPGLEASRNGCCAEAHATFKPETSARRGAQAGRGGAKIGFSACDCLTDIFAVRLRHTPSWVLLYSLLFSLCRSLFG